MQVVTIFSTYIIIKHSVQNKTVLKHFTLETLNTNKGLFDILKGIFDVLTWVIDLKSKTLKIVY
jgi:hypothetical protein